MGSTRLKRSHSWAHSSFWEEATGAADDCARGDVSAWGGSSRGTGQEEAAAPAAAAAVPAAAGGPHNCGSCISSGSREQATASPRSLGHSCSTMEIPRQSPQESDPNTEGAVKGDRPTSARVASHPPQRCEPVGTDGMAGKMQKSKGAHCVQGGSSVAAVPVTEAACSSGGMQGMGAGVTLMVRNITPCVTQEQLWNVLCELGFTLTTHLLYLPVCFGAADQTENHGFAFMHMRTQESADTVKRVLHGSSKLANHSKGKGLNVSRARVQGVSANLAHWRKSKTSRVRNPSFRPWAIDEAGNPTSL